jgi:alginate O-acetyltransferase complex protein AlgI
MVFSSVFFLFRFLPIFMILYYIFPMSLFDGTKAKGGRWHPLAGIKIRNLVLFIGSLIFYAWGEPIYVLLMLMSTVTDYCFGRGIASAKTKGVARLFLILSICTNLSVLGFFKYADFVTASLNAAMGIQIPMLDLPLPIGISFYTFQTMSYTIDVYRKEARVQKNILDFGVFVTMFPQLIAGPIVKYTDVQDVIHDHRADITQISYGCKRFVCGLAKKVLIANNIGPLWDSVARMNNGSLDVMTAWLGALAFAFQIYFDFSGYSDMAIGLGACLGFTFPENFRYPYVAASITDFWRRWHMTLSFWFRDYVYIPLGGNRKGLPRQLLNILIVWTLTGIWHGAGWNFLLWGLWFAAFLIIEKLGWGKVLARLPKLVGWFYAAFVVLVGWVFFAIEDSAGIVRYLRAMFGLNRAGLYSGNALFILSENWLLFLLAFFASLPLVHRLVKIWENKKSIAGVCAYQCMEKVVPALLLLASIAYVVEASYNPFLYFRF